MPKDVRGVMHEFKRGELHSGSPRGPVVTNRKQAIAIALSEQRQLNRGGSVAKSGKHPGFKAVQSKIAKKQGISSDRAGAILASSSRNASAKAKKKNPRLTRVKGKAKKQSAPSPIARAMIGSRGGY
jgi:hypothetical protein